MRFLLTTLFIAGLAAPAPLSAQQSTPECIGDKCPPKAEMRHHDCERKETPVS